MGISERALHACGIEVYEDPETGEHKIRKRSNGESKGSSGGSSGSPAPESEADLKYRILKARAREGEAKATERERKLSRELAQDQAEIGEGITFEDIGSILYIGGVSLMLAIIGGSILLLLAFIFVGIVGSLIGIW